MIFIAVAIMIGFFFLIISLFSIGRDISRIHAEEREEREKGAERREKRRKRWERLKSLYREVMAKNHDLNLSERAVRVFKELGDGVDWHDALWLDKQLGFEFPLEFPVNAPDDLAVASTSTWERGISSLITYEPPFEVDGLRLCYVSWQDNCRIYSCFQLLDSCPICGQEIVSRQCFGVASLGSQLANFSEFRKHDCPIAQEEYRKQEAEKRTRWMIDLFSGGLSA